MAFKYASAYRNPIVDFNTSLFKKKKELSSYQSLLASGKCSLRVTPFVFKSRQGVTIYNFFFQKN